MRNLLLLSFLFFACTKPNVQQFPVCQTSGEIAEERGQLKTRPGLILLDFDGHNQYIGCEATETQRQTIKSIVEQHYSFWQVTVTENENLYYSFNGARQRVVFTNSGVGVLGVSYLNTMVTGDELNPALVWWYGCVHNSGTIPEELAGRVATHEVGHTLGLRHTVDSCGQQYALPVNGYVPVMGLIVDAEVMSWVKQLNSQCVVQDDKRVIGKTLKRS